jgi:hypothetical protein
VIQQEYNSNFIATIRSNGGDSAYVTTTTVFSSTDEIVQPQSPVAGASAFLLDARGVGVTNNQVQAVCGGLGPAGTFYTHEGVLYNPLAYALTVDALVSLNSTLYKCAVFTDFFKDKRWTGTSGPPQSACRVRHDC